MYKGFLILSFFFLSLRVFRDFNGFFLFFFERIFFKFLIFDFKIADQKDKKTKKTKKDSHLE